MAQFYVSFEWNGLQYIGYVIAPQLPGIKHFANYQELHTTMDALGHLWSMSFEMPHPDEFAFDELTVWEKHIAEVRELVPMLSIESRRRGILDGLP